MSYTYKHPRAAIAVDLAIFDLNFLRVLLIKRKNEPFKDKWALPGGFHDVRETLIESAFRELKEETGVHNLKLRQLTIKSDPNRDPREQVISVPFIGEIPKNTAIKAGDDAKEVKWFKVNDLPDLAFDHFSIIEEGINT